VPDRARFNPDAAPYGFGNWPGHLAMGAFNHSIIEPYTGRLEGKDYLKDIQMEHMRILADEYETEIMVRFSVSAWLLSFGSTYANSGATLAVQTGRLSLLPSGITKLPRLDGR
jgi:hypothetical protein